MKTHNKKANISVSRSAEVAHSALLLAAAAFFISRLFLHIRYVRLVFWATIPAVEPGVDYLGEVGIFGHILKMEASALKYFVSDCLLVVLYSALVVAMVIMMIRFIVKNRNCQLANIGKTIFGSSESIIDEVLSDSSENEETQENTENQKGSAEPEQKNTEN